MLVEWPKTLNVPFPGCLPIGLFQKALYCNLMGSWSLFWNTKRITKFRDGAFISALGKASVCIPSSLSTFFNTALESFNLCLVDNGLLLSLKADHQQLLSSWPAYFHPINRVILLALCLHVVSSSSTFSRWKLPVMVASPTSLSAVHSTV